MIGGAVYFFTLTDAEQNDLIDRAKRSVKKPADTERVVTLKAPQVDGLLGEESTASTTVQEQVAARTTEPKAAKVSTYSGGGVSGVFASSDTNRPKPSAEFMQWAETLKVSGVVVGTPAKVMLNGRVFRAGQTVNPELGVVFAGVEDGVNKYVLVRDGSGAELRLAY